MKINDEWNKRKIPIKKQKKSLQQSNIANYKKFFYYFIYICIFIKLYLSS